MTVFGLPYQKQQEHSFLALEYNFAAKDELSLNPINQIKICLAPDPNLLFESSEELERGNIDLWFKDSLSFDDANRIWHAIRPRMNGARPSLRGNNGLNIAPLAKIVTAEDIQAIVDGLLEVSEITGVDQPLHDKAIAALLAPRV